MFLCLFVSVLCVVFVCVFVCDVCVSVCTCEHTRPNLIMCLYEYNVKVKIILEKTTKAQRGSGSISLLFL